MVVAPIVPLIVMAVATAAAAAVTAYGQIKAGQAAAAAADAQAKQLRDQAAINKQQGAIAYERTKLEGKRLSGAQLAAFAKTGVDIGVGSPLEVLSESVAEYEWRAQTSRWGYETQAVQNLNKGALTQWEGQQREQAGYIGAAGTVLSATAKIAGSFGGGGLMKGDNPVAGFASGAAGTSGSAGAGAGGIPNFSFAGARRSEIE